MDYLVYVAHDAETLQFYLWLQDYTKRFQSLKSDEKALSPVWTPPEAEEKKFTRHGGDVEFDKFGEKNGTVIRMKEMQLPVRIDFDDAPPSPGAVANDYESFISRSVRSQKSMGELAEEANSSAGLKWQGCKSTCFGASSDLAALITH